MDPQGFQPAGTWPQVQCSGQVYVEPMLPQPTNGRLPPGHPQYAEFNHVYPSGIPYGLRVTSGPTGPVPIPVKYVESDLPFGYYTNPPPHSMAIFSTDMGKLPFRPVDQVIPHRELRIFTAAEIQARCNEIRKKYWQAMKDMKKPSGWEDLWHYFDAQDLYWCGAHNLWNVINHLCAENDCLLPNMLAAQALEVGHWVDDWLSIPENKERFRKWNIDEDICRLFTGEDSDSVSGLTAEHHVWLKDALSYRHRKLLASDSNVALSYPQNTMIEVWRANSIHNWLAGDLPTPPTAITPPRVNAADSALFGNSQGNPKKTAPIIACGTNISPAWKPARKYPSPSLPAPIQGAFNYSPKDQSVAEGGSPDKSATAQDLRGQPRWTPLHLPTSMEEYRDQGIRFPNTPTELTCGSTLDLQNCKKPDPFRVTGDADADPKLVADLKMIDSVWAVSAKTETQEPETAVSCGVKPAASDAHGPSADDAVRFEASPVDPAASCNVQCNDSEAVRNSVTKPGLHEGKGCSTSLHEFQQHHAVAAGPGSRSTAQVAQAGPRRISTDPVEFKHSMLLPPVLNRQIPFHEEHKPQSLSYYAPRPQVHHQPTSSIPSHMCQNGIRDETAFWQQQEQMGIHGPVWRRIPSASCPNAIKATNFWEYKECNCEKCFQRNMSVHILVVDQGRKNIAKDELYSAAQTEMSVYGHITAVRSLVASDVEVFVRYADVASVHSAVRNGSRYWPKLGAHVRVSYSFRSKHWNNQRPEHPSGGRQPSGSFSRRSSGTSSGPAASRLPSYGMPGPASVNAPPGAGWSAPWPGQMAAPQVAPGHQIHPVLLGHDGPMPMEMDPRRIMPALYDPPVHTQALASGQQFQPHSQAPIGVQQFQVYGLAPYGPQFPGYLPNLGTAPPTHAKMNAIPGVWQAARSNSPPAPVVSHSRTPSEEALDEVVPLAEEINECTRPTTPADMAAIIIKDESQSPPVEAHSRIPSEEALSELSSAAKDDGYEQISSPRSSGSDKIRVRLPSPVKAEPEAERSSSRASDKRVAMPDMKHLFGPLGGRLTRGEASMQEKAGDKLSITPQRGSSSSGRGNAISPPGSLADARAAAKILPAASIEIASTPTHVRRKRSQQAIDASSQPKKDITADADKESDTTENSNATIGTPRRQESLQSSRPDSPKSANPTQEKTQTTDSGSQHVLVGLEERKDKRKSKNKKKSRQASAEGSVVDDAQGCSQTHTRASTPQLEQAPQEDGSPSPIGFKRKQEQRDVSLKLPNHAPVSKKVKREDCGDHDDPDDREELPGTSGRGSFSPGESFEFEFHHGHVARLPSQHGRGSLRVKKNRRDRPRPLTSLPGLPMPDRTGGETRDPSATLSVPSSEDLFFTPPTSALKPDDERKPSTGSKCSPKDEGTSSSVEFSFRQAFPPASPSQPSSPLTQSKKGKMPVMATPTGKDAASVAEDQESVEQTPTRRLNPRAKEYVSSSPVLPQFVRQTRPVSAHRLNPMAKEFVSPMRHGDTPVATSPTSSVSSKTLMAGSRESAVHRPALDEQDGEWKEDSKDAAGVSKKTKEYLMKEAEEHSKIQAAPKTETAQSDESKAERKLSHTTKAAQSPENGRNGSNRATKGVKASPKPQQQQGSTGSIKQSSSQDMMAQAPGSSKKQPGYKNKNAYKKSLTTKTQVPLKASDKNEWPELPPSRGRSEASTSSPGGATVSDS